MNLQPSSLSDGVELVPAPVTDRRDASRTRTVFRVARVLARDDEGLARIRNISDGGMRLKLGIPVVAGDTIEVAMSETQAFLGRVVWAKDGECGIQFAEWVDSVAALQSAAEDTRAGRSRPPRLLASQPVVVETERGLCVTQMRDISQHGMKITNDGSFKPGLAVKILIGPGVERRGYVRWATNNMAGLILTEPLTVEELGSVSAL